MQRACGTPIFPSSIASIRGRLHRLVCAAGALLVGGCVVSTDLSGAALLCMDEQVCPPGLTCVGGRCVADGPSDDDGGDDDGDDDGDGDGSDAGSPPTGFAFRRRLAIDNFERGELRDFPLLVALDPDRFDYGAARADGADLEFRDADGTLLPHEIEEWNPGERSILWVRVPLIEAQSGDFIDLYYGNPEAEAAQDEEAVFSSYESVYHLGDSGLAIDDAGGRNYDGEPIGSQPAPGFLSLAHSFDGVGQFIDLGTQRDFARATAGFTVEAWVNPSAAQTGVIFGASVNTPPFSRIEFRVELDQTLRGGARSQDAADGQELQLAFTGETLPLGTWSWVALVVDYAAAEMTIYIDDHVAATQGGLLLDAETPDTASGQATIGVNESFDSDFFPGLIDELRLAPVAISADWASAQYASMADELVTVGPPEAL